MLSQNDPTGLAIHVCNDGVIYKSAVRESLAAAALAAADAAAATSSPSSTAPPAAAGGALLLLVHIRLGVESLNSVYFAPLKAYFGMPGCIGIAGGRPKSSLFFIGTGGVI